MPYLRKVNSLVSNGHFMIKNKLPAAFHWIIFLLLCKLHFHKNHVLRV